jgi:ParB family transcriptional regulator, chromosome partitioning protein
MTKKGLGRGLGSLIQNETNKKETPKPATKADEIKDNNLTTLPVYKIKTNAFQPRTKFNEQAIDELAASIKEHGVLQPLLVRQVKEKYELIAGERRFKAAQKAGLKKVPVILMEADDNTALEIALIENLQREDLNIIEIAKGYKMLAEKFNFTQEQISVKMGIGRASVANTLRLLNLPEEIINLIEDNKLTTGHAKVLLGVGSVADQIVFAYETVKQNFTVRQLEKYIKKQQYAPRVKIPNQPDLPVTYLNDLSDRLHGHFGTAVRISSVETKADGRKKPGTIEIEYYSNEELEGLLQQFGINIDSEI